MYSTEIEFGGVDLFESQLNVNCIGAIRISKGDLKKKKKYLFNYIFY